MNECVELQPTAGSSDAVAFLVHRKTVPFGSYSRDAVQGKSMVLLALRPTGGLTTMARWRKQDSGRWKRWSRLIGALSPCLTRPLGMCEWDSIDSGIHAAAVRSQETFLMNGTSVAAPVVARRIFNLMAATPNGGPPPDRIAMLNALSKDEMIRVDSLPPEPAQAQISSSNEEAANRDADLHTEPDPVGAK